MPLQFLDMFSFVASVGRFTGATWSCVGVVGSPRLQEDHATGSVTPGRSLGCKRRCRRWKAPWSACGMRWRHPVPRRDGVNSKYQLVKNRGPGNNKSKTCDSSPGVDGFLWQTVCTCVWKKMIVGCNNHEEGLFTWKLRRQQPAHGPDICGPNLLDKNIHRPE